ncbi:diguanylate cyclase [Pseudoduganella sp. FT93W]|uniref:diguanylate cyclase n=1 Tax=Duganella fentianensis TaxID=2692177 RepID=A0A845HW58_9BURK|nr:ligand-binding sensor domain-containing diguanylate cyclase [Duganella fentianensis]MYN45634.1 diguanylate cyclase [Duganella fentianensis]
MNYECRNQGCQPARPGWTALIKLGLLWLFAMLGSGLPAQATERWAGLRDAVFQNYTQAQGLPNSIATAIVEDADGFLWVGTQNGLSRWDGYRFRTYQPNPAEPRSLPDNWVTALHKDGAGQLWIGTSSGGLARYDARDDHFINYRVGGQGLSHMAVNALAQDDAAGLWIGTGGGLDRLDLASGAITPQGRKELPAAPVFSLLRLRSGALLVGMGSGLYRRNGPDQPFHRVTLQGGQEGQDGQIAVHSLFEDALGQVWIGTRHNGVFRLGKNDVVAQQFSGRGDAHRVLQHSWVYAIGAAGPEEVWIGTYGQGVLAVDLRDDSYRRIRHDPALASSLAGDIIFAIFADRSGAIWLGSQRGVSRHDGQQKLVSTVFGDSRRSGGIRGADLFSVYTHSDGRIWLGLQGQGVDIIDPERNVIQHVVADADQADSALPVDHVFDFAEAANGDMFVATGRGLFRVNAAGSRVQRISIAGRPPAASTYRLLRLGDELWVGGRDDGIWVLPSGGGAVRHIDADQLSDGRITALYADAGNAVWIGSRNGLNRLDLHNGKITRSLPDKNNGKALAAGLVSSIMRDRKGRLWVATLGGGIHVLRKEQPGLLHFDRIGREQGLPSMNVDALLLDGSGKIWATTADGIVALDPDSLAMRIFHQADGLAINGYWVGSGSRTAQGELLYGGEGGLTVLRPTEAQSREYQPPLVVTAIQLGGKPVASARYNHAGQRTALEVGNSADSLTVEFAALDFTAPERIVYRYRLDGFDADWISTDALRRFASYTNLAPGQYSLLVQAADRNGNWSRHTLNLPVVVIPAWYQTLWVRALLVALALAVLVSVVQVRTALLRQRQRALEQQVEERTLVLEQTAQELRTANERLFQLATIDSLTGCANRHHFIERARDYLALMERTSQPLALLIMDLDGFKQVNDRYGHPFGDEVLRATVKAAQLTIRSTDMLGRMGGEEFAVLMPDTDRDGAWRLAERVRVAIAAAEVCSGEIRLHPTVSIGLAMRAAGEQFDGLYVRTDVALYAAKEAGRNRTVMAS